MICLKIKSDNMADKILVAYASKTNATSDNAEIIAEELSSKGFSISKIDLRQTNKPDLSEYDAVVVGTGIRMGLWYGPAKKLVKENDFSTKKLAVFVSCSTANDEEKRPKAVSNYIDSKMKKYNFEPFSKAAFPGIDPGNKKKNSDPEAVKSWTNELAKQLK